MIGIHVAVAEMLRRFNLVEQVIVSSFLLKELGALRRYAPELQRAALTSLSLHVLVSFARPGRSKAQSFPRKRESSFPSARFQELENWIPAFAGMTAVSKGIRCQMTPVPRRPDH